jgi:hypothetical protein
MFIIQVIDAAMADALMREAPEKFPTAELADLVALYYDLPSSQG